MRLLSSICLISLCVVQFVGVASSAESGQVFSEQTFSDNDAVLVTSEDGRVLYQWRAKELLIPASLSKLVSSYLAIDKWGMSHRFHTDFYQIGRQLWVKGYGDPYLISEEIDAIAEQLQQHDLSIIKSVHIDASYFSAVPVPGRSSVSDPYNAPLSAVAANFNTVFLQKKNNKVISAEPQTPLTQTALKLAASNKTMMSVSNAQKTRVNLINVANAQRHFAEILAIKLGLERLSIEIDQRLPSSARLIYRHFNNQTLETVLTGAMVYSNNFIANQVFLKLAESEASGVLSFDLAQSYVSRVLKEKFSWQQGQILEGAGLSRDNKLSAVQIDQILALLKPHQTLLREVPTKSGAQIYAKTGTLNDVRNYAGYINFPQQQYRFVFMFNRSTSYRFRDQLLHRLVQQLSALEE